MTGHKRTKIAPIRRAGIPVALVTLLVVPSCQNYLPDFAHATATVPERRYVQEGFVSVRDGEEAHVALKVPYHAPPRLVIVEISQCWFKDTPFKKEDFEIRQLEATSFKLLSRHCERNLGAWATIKWRAEGIRAGESPAGASTRQEQIMAMVNRAGGTMTLDSRSPSAMIIGIDLHHTRVTDADVALLEGLTALRVLNLYGTNVSDAGLEHLAGLTGLQALYLNDTAVSDAGLRSLQHLSALRELGLCRTRASDQGLAFLIGLNNLQVLSLSGPRITDQGLKHLQRLPSLRQITLLHTSVTDAGVQALEQTPPRKRITR